ncbi:MAG: ATP-dependent zinc protease [gamma proteobacterium symbiont of Phacoides pectinatus]
MKKKLQTLGWREWIHLEPLGLPPIKAKVDTGAKTSALHAFKVRKFTRGGVPWVRFHVHPDQRDADREVVCEAPVHDRRRVTDSGGHTQERYVIKVEARIGDQTLMIEMTLTNRDTMAFRVLLGRSAMKDVFTVDPRLSFCMGQPPFEPHEPT